MRCRHGATEGPRGRQGRTHVADLGSLKITGQQDVLGLEISMSHLFHHPAGQNRCATPTTGFFMVTKQLYRMLPRALDKLRFNKLIQGGEE